MALSSLIGALCLLHFILISRIMTSCGYYDRQQTSFFVEAFSPSCPYKTRPISILLSAVTPSATAIQRIQNTNTDLGEGRENVLDRKSILLLNQRKLPRQILKCRSDAKGALDILGNAYPHLAFSLDMIDGDDTLQYMLHGRDHMMNSSMGEKYVCTKRLGDTLLIIDGKSIVATMEVLRKADGNNVPAALHLLRLLVEGVDHNRRLREKQGNSFVDYGIDNEDEKHELSKVYKAVFSLLGNAKHYWQGDESNYSPLITMHLLRHHMPKVAQVQPGAEIYHAVFSALGKLGECDLILEILEEMEEIYSHESTNLQTSEDAGETTLITNLIPPTVDKMSYQTAISALARHGHCREATQLFYRMKSTGLLPDSNIYNELLIGIAKEAGRERGSSTTNSSTPSWHKVALQILEEMKTHSDRQPTEQSYNSVLSACGKEGEWDDAARVAEEKAKMLSRSTHGSSVGKEGDEAVVESGVSNENRCLQSKSNESSTNAIEQNIATYFHKSLKCFRKVGKGSDSWWEIGRYSISGVRSGQNAAVSENNDGNRTGLQKRSIIIGIQPHRNPVSNGLSIVFYDEASKDKLGRMLLKNASSKQVGKNKSHLEPRYYSSLVGMEVNKARRGEGLSKVFVALWLHICLETNTYPRAAVMNKPLISLVLMGFGFLPQNGGSRVGLLRLKGNSSSIDQDGHSAQFGLYSPSAKSLQGLFSQRVLRTQNIAILNRPPSLASRQNGTAIYLKTGFEHPIAILDGAVNYNPPPSLKNEEMNAILDWHRNNANCKGYPSEQKQKIRQITVQRKLLVRKINSVLKKNAKTAAGHLAFSANSTLVKDAFFSYLMDFE